MTATRLLRYPFVALVLAAFALPPVWLLLSSLKPELEIFAWPPTVLPSAPTLDNFRKAWLQDHFAGFFLNSTFVAAVSSAISVAISVMAGYALAKFRFAGDTFFFLLIMSALMIPLQIILIPIFLVLRDLHLLNTLWGVILAPAATPTGVLIMRQYIRGIPDSLLEAARMDGTSEWRILWRIVVPLSLPAIATLTAFSFVARWNDFLWPFLVINDRSQWTVQLAIASNVGQWDINWPRLLAMSVLSVIPTFALFVTLQRFFMSGMMAGATKE
ncbi:carbohydrate ABC transporter permease [Oharaeibacter diazotrophicus]|uniref:Carbohydrate ABC transporter membrane protein 2 (CUT1 family) n=1 Tax=Oharaeibacter diazotrophicus TaxID=1920512 RepID=A0A4R6RMH6_9HYPH|nr:carbohydrate ABC transporter permease [Oharaeibacter diazotrophicus]TDP87227.1 carbohydrate ABC transporter membrane protein 2 (CUT1 family) [Oharaeibacter diazotrophicus]BBE70830.1 L-arabinose transport system permease protein AraQ [Pleomorphomonas sp. SM30]GLS77579.1 sugar ABC transporter permease [Oharaeibacter diazotrophicus]